MKGNEKTFEQKEKSKKGKKKRIKFCLSKEKTGKE